jgi:putative SOS response-associated peptidase YedK
VCGRYTLASPADELIESFEVPAPAFAFASRYNIAPGQDALVVAEDARGRRLGPLTWGLAPNWMDEPGPGFINARAETAHDKGAFREAFARRRCLVPADGFYEWKREGAAKVPYWLHPRAGGVIAFAGIWERWSRPGAVPRHAFAILTTDANAEVRPIHDRMPVVLLRADWRLWLAKDSDTREVQRVLQPAPDGTFAARRVSTRVNRPSEDDPGLIEPA